MGRSFLTSYSLCYHDIRTFWSPSVVSTLRIILWSSAPSYQVLRQGRYRKFWGQSEHDLWICSASLSDPPLLISRSFELRDLCLSWYQKACCDKCYLKAGAKSQRRTGVVVAEVCGSSRPKELNDFDRVNWISSNSYGWESHQPGSQGWNKLFLFLHSIKFQFYAKSLHQDYKFVSSRWH